MKRVLVSFFFFVLVFCLAAQEKQKTGNSPPNGAQIFDKVTKEFNLLPEASFGSDSDFRKKLQAYDLFAVQHDIDVLQWDSFNTKFVFWIVISLVLVGIISSLLHFYLGLFEKEKGQQIRLRISTKGLEIKTSLVGLVLLLMSFGFLTLYMITAYPIKYVNPSTANPISTPQSIDEKGQSQ
jgi:hypothetical protein